MDIHFSEQDLAFRDEVRQWLSENWTAEHAAEIRYRKKFKKSIVAWEKRLANKGWIAPGWPEEHGGTGWTPTQKYIFEMVKHDIGNDKTFVVIDEDEKKSNCFDLNDNFNGFVETENVRLTRKMDKIWKKYSKNRTKFIQKFNSSYCGFGSRFR